MKSFSRLLCIFSILTIILSFDVIAADTIPYPTYTIDSEYVEADSPAAYIPSQLIKGYTPADRFMDPVDMQIEKDKLYILDAGRNMVIILDSNFKLIKTISDFNLNNKKDTFNKPQGLTVSSDGEIYVADTENSRIIKFDSSFNAVKIFSHPAIDVLGKDYVYKPLKIGVDSAKRMYVVAQGINRGLVELNSEGAFLSFFGAPKVSYDIFSYMWKRILTKDQSKYLENFVPTEFSNLRIDQDGFIYATIKANDYKKVFNAIKSHDKITMKAVEKFNASGVDILRRNGDIPILGDVNFQVSDKSDGSGKSENTNPSFNPSTFEDIAVNSSGIYYCLDSKRNRIFTYDSDGNLLYAFGNSGNQTGNFTTPTAIDVLGDKLLVLDKTLKRITVFNKTDYGNNLHNAASLYSNGKYEESLVLWKDVIRSNANLSFAYIGMGKCYYYLKDYDNAIKYFEMAKEKYYCSKAYEKKRTLDMIEYFVPAVFTIIALIILFIIFKTIIFRKKRRGTL